MMKSRMGIAAAAALLAACSACAASVAKENMTAYSREAIAYRALGARGSKTPEPAVPARWKAAGQTPYLALYYDEGTAEVAVFDKRAGAWWYSNSQPSGDGENGPPARITAAAASQLSVDTVTSENKSRHYDSSKDSLAKEQVRFELERGSLRVTYAFGSIAPDMAGVPRRLTDDRFRELRSRMESKYSKYLFFFKQDEAAGYWSPEEGLTKPKIQNLRDAFESIGYTEKDRAADELAAGYSGEESAGGFEIPLEYTLQEDSLRVRIAGKEIRYPSAEIITNIQVLSFFGALAENGEGYALIPDGSGAVMDTSAAQGNIHQYTGRIYGRDITLAETNRNNRSYDALLPVFGVSRPDAGFLAVVEDNEGAASVTAAKPMSPNLYTSVGSMFELCAVENIGLASDAFSNLVVTSDTRYEGDCTVRYVFLDKDRADYAGMARTYREYLTRYGGLSRMEAAGPVPFLAETVGGMRTSVSMLGFPYDADIPLTAYEDNIALIGDLRAKGVGDIRLMLSGWMNGGTDQKLARSVKAIDSLGGGKLLRKLARWTSENGVALYPGVLFNTMARGDGLSAANRYSAKTLGNKKAAAYAFDVSTGESIPAASRYLVSPAYKKALLDSVTSALDELGFRGLALSDIAHTAYSDYTGGNESLRTESMLQSRELVKRAAESHELLLRSPNNLTAPLARLYDDVPASSSAYLMETASVPFYQMVFHGAADYTFEALNYGTDLRKSILKCVEYGASPKFKFIWREDDRLGFSESGELYAALYSRWADSVAEAYEFINARLEPVRTAVMVGHRQVAPHVYETVYDNGYAVLVNYAEEAVQVNGRAVAGRDAAVLPPG